MKRKFCLALFLFLFSLVFLSSSYQVRAISISNCANLNQAGATYNLTASFTNNTVPANQTCINITANNIVFNCQGYNINSNGTYGTFGIFINRSSATNTNITIQNCNVTNWYYEFYLNYTNNNTLTNNKITIYSNYTYGIFLGSSSNNSITGNNVTMYSVNANSNSGYGIYLYSSSSNSITGNNVTTNSSNGYGIYLNSSSNNNSITGNNVTTDGANAIGIYLSSSSNTTMKNNKITVPTATKDGLGLFIDGSSVSDFIHEIDESNNVNNRPVKYFKYISNQVIANNNSWATLIVASSNNITITNVTPSPWGIGIQAANLTNSNISYNKINTTAFWGYGIHLWSSSNNNIRGNNVTTSGGHGIYLWSSSNNNIRGNNVTTSSGWNIGIALGSSSNNNSITGNNVTTSSGFFSYGIYLSSSSNNRFFDSTINAINSNDIAMAGTSNEVNYLINCTYNKADIYSASSQNVKLYNQYYLDVYVNNTAGSPIASALVIANSSTYKTDNPTNNFSTITNSSGYIERQILTEFMANGSYNLGNYLYFNNYTVNASKSGYSNASTTVNLTKTLSTIVTLTLSTGLGPVPTTCEGYVKLSIQPTFAPPSSYAEPSAYGVLSSCEGNTVNFTQDNCTTGPLVSSCIVTHLPTFSTSGGGCVGNSFPLPSVSGPYTYCACIDKNGLNGFNDTGEQACIIYTVGYSSLPEFGWMGILQIMILASVIILLIRKNQN